MWQEFMTGDLAGVDSSNSGMWRSTVLMINKSFGDPSSTFDLQVGMQEVSDLFPFIAEPWGAGDWTMTPFESRQKTHRTFAAEGVTLHF